MKSIQPQPISRFPFHPPVTRPRDGFEVAVDAQDVPRSESPARKADPSWLFARRYDQQQILNRPEMAQAFVDDYVRGEAEFFARARHATSGLSYDGIDLDPKTGQAREVRAFSAASKECLDLGICVKALYGDPLISRLVSPEAPEKAPEVATRILEQKILSYEKYRQSHPGFAGYFTWFESGAAATPVEGWKQAIPTLDLGEMLWSLLLAEKALRDTGRAETAAKFQGYNERLAEKAREAFFDETQGGVRGHVEISDPKSPHSHFSGSGLMTGQHGVHEGQMMILYMELFGGLSKEESDQVWDDIEMTRIEHQHGTTWEGFWGSPHEEWAHLFLPYRDHKGFADLFRIREKIRSQNAVERGYPGFAASAHHPEGKGYMSAAGIEGVNSQPLEFQNSYTPYGAFPMLLQFAGQLTGNVGLAWLHNMLQGPRLQGPLGAGESGNNSGTAAAPVKTVDVSYTNLLALSGGLGKETAALLRERNLYDRFLARLDGEFRETFAGAPLREPSPFALPPTPAPPGLPPYATPEASH